MAEWLDSNPVFLLGAAAALIAIGRWVGGVNNDRSRFHEFMEEIRSDIKKIFQRLGEAPIAGSSPVRLTEYGEDIAKTIEAAEWATATAPDLKERVEGKKPYQVEQVARAYVADELSEEWQERVAQEAFRRGARRDDITSVLWVVLRDELLRLTGQELED